MYEEYFSEEHHIFRTSVRKFVEKEIKPHIDQWEDEELFPVELYRKVSDMGLMGLEYPEIYGGIPCDKFMHIVYTEEMIAACGSVGLVAGLGSYAIAMPPVLNLGTEAQKQQFLVPVLKGEKIAALGITEPNAGSDVANIQTRAVRDGDDYIVNGAKTFITSGCRAHFITTAVRTGGPGYKGVSLELRPLQMFEADARETKLPELPGPPDASPRLAGRRDCSTARGPGLAVNFETEVRRPAVRARLTYPLSRPASAWPELTLPAGADMRG